MSVSRLKIAGFIAKQTFDGIESEEFTKQIAAYLISVDKVDELDSLMRDVQGCWADAGKVVVTITSAHPLDNEAKALVKAEVKKIYKAADKIFITEQIDPEILGGVRLNLANKQLDLSAQASLNKFRQLTEIGKD
jgi:F0F1-type ATP synthase delta subunit